MYMATCYKGSRLIGYCTRTHDDHTTHEALETKEHYSRKRLRGQCLSLSRKHSAACSFVRFGAPRAQEHCMAGDALPYRRTFAWEVIECLGGKLVGWFLDARHAHRQIPPPVQ